MVRTCFIAIALHASFISFVHADDEYTVYEADEFGHKDLFAEPKAIIKFDDLMGEGKVYEPDILGRPDTIKGPIYIIESDSPLHALSPFEDDFRIPPPAGLSDCYGLNRHRHGHDDRGLEHQLHPFKHHDHDDRDDD